MGSNKVSLCTWFIQLFILHNQKGHEIVGIVTELGSQVTLLSIGDRVGVGAAYIFAIHFY